MLHSVINKRPLLCKKTDKSAIFAILPDLKTHSDISSKKVSLLYPKLSSSSFYTSFVDDILNFESQNIIQKLINLFFSTCNSVVYLDFKTDTNIVFLKYKINSKFDPGKIAPTRTTPFICF